MQLLLFFCCWPKHLSCSYIMNTCLMCRLQLHLDCLILTPFWWHTEPKVWQLCQCPNTYGPNFTCIMITDLWTKMAYIIRPEKASGNGQKWTECVTDGSDYNERRSVYRCNRRLHPSHRAARRRSSCPLWTEGPYTLKHMDKTIYIRGANYCLISKQSSRK